MNNVNELDIEGAKMNDRMAGSTERRVITEDSAYLETYQQIFQLLCKKAQFLYGNAYLLENPKVLTDEVCFELRAINEEIRKAENEFWVQVEKCKEAGKNFVAEQLAGHYKLDIFQKRAMLLLLFLRINQPREDGFSAEQLVQILDARDSIADRFENLGYFSDQASDFVKNVLLVSQRSFPRLQDKEYRIHPRIMDQMSILLRGEKPDWNKTDMGQKKLRTPEEGRQLNTGDIGTIRKPVFTFEDIYLSPVVKEKVQMFLDGCKGDAMKELGITKTIKKGAGTTFLFYGVPGTGKSMTADAIASYVNKQVLVVDYSKITSRWFGETEKQIALMFSQARKKNLVLLLDEADTLLCSRRFSVQEHNIRFVNEMLQELERFPGIAILTTNMHTLLDPALERRIALKIKFELPDQKIREDIWRSHIPKETEIDPDVDFERLARIYQFSGGNIKNSVLNAFRKLIQSQTKKLTMEMLVAGADIEKEGMFSSGGNKRFIGFSVGSGT